MTAFRSAEYSDDVLNMWVRGSSAPEIAGAIGPAMTTDRVTDIIKRARRGGDPRAVAKKRGGVRTDGPWTPESEAKVRDLVDAGYSTREIAAEIGKTPGQVGGLISRRGLKLARPAVGGVGNAKPKPITKPKSPYSFGGFKRRAIVQPKKVRVEDVAPIASPFSVPFDEPIARPAGRIGVVELTETMCRFPIGTPGKSNFTFCGADRVQGLPYCAGHCRIAYPARAA